MMNVDKIISNFLNSILDTGSNILTVQLSAKITAFVLAVIFTITGNLQAQDSHLEFRFNNGKIDQSSNTYGVDIEVKTSFENAALYAMNLRFFYEAENLNLKSFTDFKEGYDFIHGQKESIIGGKNSAKTMFDLSGTAGYINQGLELKKVNLSSWEVGKWQKIVSVNFEILTSEFKNLPCPSFMWDKQQESGKGGLLQGSMGTTASLISSIGEQLECNSALCRYEDLNWFMDSNKAPFGKSSKNACLASLNVEKEILDLDFLEVYQNTPNPFVNTTSIQFNLPKSDKVTLSIFDLKGVLMHKQTGEYKKGLNTIELDKSIELTSGTFMYHIETTDSKSEIKKMIKFQ